jgi:hypothetical protein
VGDVTAVTRGDRAMIFAHGFGCDQNMWRFVAPALEADCGPGRLGSSPLTRVRGSACCGDKQISTCDHGILISSPPPRRQMDWTYETQLKAAEARDWLKPLSGMISRRLSR